jgi:hypothetical protein
MHFSLDRVKIVLYNNSRNTPLFFMRTAKKTLSHETAAVLPDPASRQRQLLDQLTKDYLLQVRDILHQRELVKGSVYLLKTRCGNASCHCAKPEGPLHSATVLSWSQAGKTHIRSLAAGDRARIRRLTENYRRLRQARAALIKLHKQALEAIDRLAQALLLPPPSAGKERK